MHAVQVSSALSGTSSEIARSTDSNGMAALALAWPTTRSGVSSVNRSATPGSAWKPMPPLSAPGPGLLFGEGPAPLDSPEAKSARARVAESAKAVIGQRSLVVGGQKYRFDCSGVTRAIYARAGFPLGGRPSFRGENDVSVLYRHVRESGSLRRSDPLVGDLVFFDDTYDRNGDGVRNDPLSHVGVVEDVLDDGVHVVGRVRGVGHEDVELAVLLRDLQRRRRLEHRGVGQVVARQVREELGVAAPLKSRGSERLLVLVQCVVHLSSLPGPAQCQLTCWLKSGVRNAYTTRSTLKSRHDGKQSERRRRWHHG